MIDGSIARAHKHAAGARSGQANEGLGRSCGGFSTKIHAKVDALGLPLGFEVTAGQASDIGRARTLVGEESCEQLIADRGYDSDEFREWLQARGTIPVIPGRKNRREPVVYDAYTYKERNAIERLFGRLKEYRRIATRYDKTAVMYKAFLTLAAILIWIKL